MERYLQTPRVHWLTAWSNLLAFSPHLTTELTWLPQAGGPLARLPYLESRPQLCFPQKRRGKPLLYHVDMGRTSAGSSSSVCPPGRQPPALVYTAIYFLVSTCPFQNQCRPFLYITKKAQCFSQNKTQSFPLGELSLFLLLNRKQLRLWNYCVPCLKPTRLREHQGLIWEHPVTSDMKNHIWTSHNWKQQEPCRLQK